MHVLLHKLKQHLNLSISNIHQQQDFTFLANYGVALGMEHRLYLGVYIFVKSKSFGGLRGRSKLSCYSYALSGRVRDYKVPG